MTNYSFSEFHESRAEVPNFDEFMRLPATSNENLFSDSSVESRHAMMLRLCRQRYFHTYPMKLPYPDITKAINSSLLYVPEAVRLFSDKPHHSLTESEIDMVGFDILPHLPLWYIPLRQDEIRAHLAQEKSFLKPMLDPEDAALIAIDLEDTITHQQDLPSLQFLLQKPIYTELSQVSAEERHEGRLARLEELQHSLQHHQTSLPAPPVSRPPLTSSIKPHLENSSESTHARKSESEGRSESLGATSLLQSILSGSSLIPPPLNGASGRSSLLSNVDGGVDSVSQEWRREVQRSFQKAKGLDKQWDDFLVQIAREKFGLAGVGESREDQLAVKQWIHHFWDSLCHPSLTPSQQQFLWQSFCVTAWGHFSGSSTGTHHPKKDDSGELLRRHVTMVFSKPNLTGLLESHTAYRDSIWERWQSIISDYEKCLSLVRNPELSRGTLRWTATDLPSPEDAVEEDGAIPHTEVFSPNILPGGLLRRGGKGPTSAFPFPVEMLPVYPSGLTPTTESRDSQLASQLSRITHNVLIGERPVEEMGGVGKSGTSKILPSLPHVLVGHNTLLRLHPLPTCLTLEDPHPSVPKMVPYPLSDLTTLAYTTSRLHLFEEWHEDTEYTGSVFFRLHQTQPVHTVHGENLTEEKEKEKWGTLTNINGRYATYDTISTKVTHHKKINPKDPPIRKYILLFQNAINAAEMAMKARKSKVMVSERIKRQRELDEEMDNLLD